MQFGPQDQVTGAPLAINRTSWSGAAHTSDDYKLSSTGFENNSFVGDVINLDTLEHLKRLAEISNIVVPVTTVAVLVFGLIGNALVVYVTLVTDRKVNHPIHSMFVLNLAAADILFLIVSGPYWVSINARSQWEYGSFLCPFIPFLSITSKASSIFTICALAWIRFMALTMPFRFRRSRLSTRKAGCGVVAVAWIAAIALAAPNLVFVRMEEQEIAQDLTITICDWKEGADSWAYSWPLMVFTYILPLMIVSAFYIIIEREVLCFMRAHGDGNRRRRVGTGTVEEKERLKGTMVVLTLILAFLICWFPHFLSNVLIYSGILAMNNHTSTRFILQAVAQCMGYAHACVNPFIYTFASPIFRRELRRSVRQHCSVQYRGHDLGMTNFVESTPPHMIENACNRVTSETANSRLSTQREEDISDVLLMKTHHPSLESAQSVVL